MAQRCSICAHPHRDDIDAALVSGVPNRRVAAQFGVSESAIRRHKKNGHIQEKLAKAEKIHEVASADRLLSIIEGLLCECLRTVKSAKGQDGGAPDGSLKLKALREARETAKLLLEVQGQVPSDTPTVTVNIVENQWVAFRAVILSALCPDCRKSVVERLQGREIPKK